MGSYLSLGEGLWEGLADTLEAFYTNNYLPR